MFLVPKTLGQGIPPTPQDDAIVLLIILMIVLIVLAIVLIGRQSSWLASWRRRGRC
jgi:hypothetical protein